MKNTAKILLLDLPPGLVAAFLQHRPAEWEFSLKTGGAPFDALVTAHKTAPDETLRALPILALPGTRKESLSSHLRRLGQMVAQPALYTAPFQIGSCHFSPQEKIIETGKGATISLTERETEILLYLANRNNAPVTRDDFLKDIWRYQEGIDTHTLETHIYRLRQKLAENTGLSIEEEKGYRLVAA